MKRTDAINRYLGGQMSPDEMARFSEQLLFDPKLRDMLDAEELIRGTVRRDLAAISSEHSRTRAHVMGTLAALSAAAREGTLTDIGAGSSGGGGSNGASYFGWGTTAKIIVGAIVGAGILTGLYLLVPRPEDAAPSMEPASRVEQLHDMPANPRFDSTPDRREASDAPMQAQPEPAIPRSSSETPGRSSNAVHSPQQQEIRSRVPRTVERASVQEPEDVAPKNEPSLNVPTKQAHRPVIRKSDSVKLQMRVKVRE